MPALVGLAPTLNEFTIERASGRDLPEDTEISTVSLTWLADLGPADAAAVRDVDGRALVARLLGNELVLEEFRPDEVDAVVAVEHRGEVELNPQPLPPNPPEVTRIAASAGIDDAVTALIPGHPPALVLAWTTDGDVVVVDAASPDSPRRAGTYEGPLVGMNVDGSFAISTNASTVQLFSHHRYSPTSIRTLLS